MFGFGLMDNSILIRAGDAIDNSLGDMLGLTGSGWMVIHQNLQFRLIFSAGFLIAACQQTFLRHPKGL